jgi:hypothetical protein
LNRSPDFLFGGQVQGFHSLILTGFCDFGNGKVQLLIMSEQLLWMMILSCGYSV